jgi:hypothetical protein
VIFVTALSADMRFHEDARNLYTNGRIPMRLQPPMPKEHGAWAMLYAPLLIAIGFAGRFDTPVWLFIAVVTLAFLAHEPVATLARFHGAPLARKERLQQARLWLIIYAILAAPACALLLFFYNRWHLLTMGVLLMVLFGLHTYLTSKRIERQFTGEFLGVLSLTLTAPAAYYVALGRIDKLGLLLWLFNLLYFSSAIFYVKMRVSRSVKRSNADLLTWQCAGYHLLLLAGITLIVWRGWFSALVLLAFLPAIGRAFSAMRPEENRLNLKRLGIAEIGYTVAYVLFLVFGLRASQPF